MLDRDFKRAVIIFICFLLGLILIVWIRIKLNVKEIPKKVEIHTFKEHKDWNLTEELEPQQQLFYERLTDQK